MPSLPFSDGVLQLAQVGGVHRMRALLKAATELFVSEPRHGRTEIAMYEELALQLLKNTAVEDRRAVAAMLAHQPDAPQAVLSALLHDEIAVAEVLIAEAETLSDLDLLSLVTTGSEAHLVALAARPRIGLPIVEALLRRMPTRLLPALLVNTTIRIPQQLLPLVIDRAKGDPTVARAIAGRQDDVEDTDLTDLFLELDERGRRRVIQALEMLALREFAARRPMPRMNPPDPARVEALGQAALSRNVDLISVHLASILQVDRATAARLLVDRGGEPLAIALKASGMDGVIAMRVILFSGGHEVRGYFDVKRLVDLYESVSLRSALMLVGRWREAPETAPGHRRHVPQMEAGSPVRASQPAARPADGTAARPEIRRDRA